MVVCGDSMELNRDYESAAIYKWRKKRKKAFVLFICIVGICFLVTRMVRVEDKTTVKVHNMHTEQNEKENARLFLLHTARKHYPQASAKYIYRLF